MRKAFVRNTKIENGIAPESKLPSNCHALPELRLRASALEIREHVGDRVLHRVKL
jgi:hypothetical protein